ncbi:MAG: hypothetical protein LQ350_002915 [Teloschistes chrysophthalmus]|nr:MAG: hypothetical protein LQ350_002915 [Niorma chrysophthalma]
MSLRDFTQDPVREVKQRLSALENERDGLAVERRTLEEQLSRANIHATASHETNKELAELKIQNRQISELNSKHNNPNFEDQKLFREDLTGFPTESLQRFCLRAKLFELLDARLLSAQNFGIGESEKTLGKFERALHACRSGQ